MTTVAEPIIGCWYKDLDNNLKFNVVAIDESDESIEVQYLNGDIGEFDTETWYASTFISIEDPEDWNAAYGEMEIDDLGYSDTDEHKPKDEDLDIEDYFD